MFLDILLALWDRGVFFIIIKLIFLCFWKFQLYVLFFEISCRKKTDCLSKNSFFEVLFALYFLIKFRVFEVIYYYIRMVAELVGLVTKLVFNYQRMFRKDVFIDFNCFRRMGHNEVMRWFLIKMI